MVSFTVPILPGKLDSWREFIRTLARDRLDEYEKSRRRAGISREITWLQRTPQGEIAIVHIETKNVGKTLAEFAQSEEPFDVWFRQQFLDIHGLDLSTPLQRPKLGFEWGLKGFVADVG